VHEGQHLRRDFLERRDPAGAELAGGFPQPVGGGEQHEQVGLQQDRDQGGQPVVIAEFQFIDRDHVIFVDHRDDPMVEQAHEGMACVQVAAAVLEVAVGEQDLAGPAPQLGEQAVVGGHEA
jgi:hypothetical protein